MSTNSAKQGGSLSDMAVSGTSIPGDAGVQNIIPSVPRPDQTGANRSNVVDNATDIPRSSADVGATGEVSTGTGDILPAAVEKKRLHGGDEAAFGSAGSFKPVPASEDGQNVARLRRESNA